MCRVVVGISSSSLCVWERGYFGIMSVVVAVAVVRDTEYYVLTRNMTISNRQFQSLCQGVTAKAAELGLIVMFIGAATLSSLLCCRRRSVKIQHDGT